MSVQVVAAKMAEVELKDVPNKELSAVSPLTPRAEEKGLSNSELNASAPALAPTPSPTAETAGKGDPSPLSSTPITVKMPQASAMKRPDPQQNGGEAFVNRDGTVAEAPRMKKVEDGLKLNSQTYCQFLEDTFFKQWYRKKSISFKKNLSFVQNNGPTHASKYFTAWLASKGLKEEKIMTWPLCSPDLNPIENLWSLIKCEMYREGKQYTSLNSVWEAVVAAACNVGRKQIKQLT